jgi:hypothetical protein
MSAVATNDSNRFRIFNIKLIEDHSSLSYVEEDMS